MPDFPKVDVDALLKLFDEGMDRQLAEDIGQPDALRAGNASRLMQRAAVQFIHTELNAGATINEVGNALADAIGASIVQVAAVMHPAQRLMVVKDMLEMIAMHIQIGLEKQAKGEAAMMAAEEKGTQLDPSIAVMMPLMQ